MKYLSQHYQQLNASKVIVRCNFDVPIEEGQVTDTTRIESAIPTLKLLLDQHCQLVLLAHYDRPDGQPDPSKSLKPVIPILEKLLEIPITFVDYQASFEDVLLTINEYYHQASAQSPSLLLLENLRFWPEEEANDPQFGQQLSKLADAFVNEAFANCHRAHASIATIPLHLPSYAGLELEQELQALNKAIQAPKKPVVVVIGGAKLETKEPLINAFKDTADHILIGGKLALDLQAHPKPLPSNAVVATLVPEGKDIDSASASQFSKIIMAAGTVIWNGAMGIFEEPVYQAGTKTIAEAITKTSAYTLVGGGDTEAALSLFNLESGIDHISTGGGAMLDYLVDQQIPGIAALEKNL